MDSTLSASSATCRVSRKQALALPDSLEPPAVTHPAWGAGPRGLRLGCLPQQSTVHRGVPGVSQPRDHRPPATVHVHIPKGGPWPYSEACSGLPAGQRQKRVLKRGVGSAQPFACSRHQWGPSEATWIWGHVLTVLSPWVAEEGHPCGVDQEPESFLRKAGPPESPSCLGPCHCLLPGEQVWP